MTKYEIHPGLILHLSEDHTRIELEVSYSLYSFFKQPDRMSSKIPIQLNYFLKTIQMMATTPDEGDMDL